MWRLSTAPSIIVLLPSRGDKGRRNLGTVKPASKKRDDFPAIGITIFIGIVSFFSSNNRLDQG